MKEDIVVIKEEQNGIKKDIKDKIILPICLEWIDFSLKNI